MQSLSPEQPRTSDRFQKTRARILDAAARMAGRGHMARALLGDLQVDASRFRETFGFAQSHGLAASIAESGRQYRRLRSGGAGGHAQ